jgi:hypothetical protein
MVIETNVTYDYSFYYKQNTNVNPSPKTHNDVYYHRMQDTTTAIPTLPHSMNMGNINRDKSGEAYYEFVYSPLYPKKTIEKSTHHVQEISEKNMSYYVKRLFCCYG